jgi:DNA-binding response OmpR family regulator
MLKHVVFVIGPSKQTRPVVSALRDREMAAWADQFGRAASDARSFEWADAVVVMDGTLWDGNATTALLTEFEGPTLLATSKSMSGDDVASLIGTGFDAVVPFDTSPETLAARVAALLRAWRPPENVDLPPVCVPLAVALMVAALAAGRIVARPSGQRT